MSDISVYVIEPMKRLVKDSAYLVQKCTKPDSKGWYLWYSIVKIIAIDEFCEPLRYKPIISHNSTINIPYCIILINVLLKQHCRFSTYSVGHWDRIPDNGFYWLFRQNSSHPHQQYPGRRRSIVPEMEERKGKQGGGWE